MKKNEIPGPENYTIPPDQAGQRLDVFVTTLPAALTRSTAARLIHEGHVLVAGRAAKPGLVLRLGDQVAVTLPAAVPSQVAAQALPLEILFEDEHLAVINKPAGMVTHPAPGHADGTLVNALLHHLSGLSGIGGEQRPGIVHRLDKDTSGVMLVAKHDRAHQALSSGIQARTIQRFYRAVVWGNLPLVPKLIENDLGRDPKNRQRFTVVSKGRPASTLILSQEILGSGFSLLEVKINTGRTHQIRIHCRHVGNPIVGDRVYGKSGEIGGLARLKMTRPERQLLHAARLEFTHPFTGRPVVVKAEWPGDFTAFLKQCRERKER
jgi:23S rRNA pseudouridine1911/1915/1917 synthase